MAWQHPWGDAARDANGRPSRCRRIQRRPAPPAGSAFLGPDICGRSPASGRRPVSWRRSPPARIGIARGSRAGGMACRRRIRRREAVPPVGGTVGYRAIARHDSGERGRALRGPAGTLRRPFIPPGDRRTAAAGPIGPASLGGPCAAAADSPPGVRRQRPPDWRVASLPATRGIECETGESSSVYMAEWCAPGGGFEPPRLLHPAVFKTAAFSTLPIRRWWRPLPPNLSARRVSICTPPASGSTWDFGGFQGFGMGRPHRGVYGRRPTGRREVWEQSIYPIQDIMVLQLHTGTVE